MSAISILMAYEDDNVLEIISSHFKARGCRVTRALGRGHEELLDLLRRKLFDVVIVSRIMEPDQRHLLSRQARDRNPHAVIVLIGSDRHPRFDHDTVSFAGWDYVLSPSGRPELWQYILECLERAELEQRNHHARDLIGKFKRQVSTISESVSGHFGRELREIRDELEQLMKGDFGPLSPEAASRLDALSKRTGRLIREADMVSRGFIPGRIS